jgi:uncharacterized coiled-coil protein SlyX
MKNLLFPLFLLFASCDSTNYERQALINDSLRNKVFALENAQAITNSRLDDLEQEQAFQYKDVDSLKKAVVWVGTIAVKHDSIVADKEWKKDRAERRGRFWAGVVKTIVGR